VEAVVFLFIMMNAKIKISKLLAVKTDSIIQYLPCAEQAD